MKTHSILAILSLSLAHTLALAAPNEAQPEFEVTCRIKAKELAAETYRSCITENKTAQIEQVRKEYQDKLKSLKDEYEKEVQRMGGKKPAAKNRTAKMVSRASTLPSKNSSAKANDGDFTIDVKPSAKPTETDDSTMDIPEPIPVGVETVNPEKKL